MVFNPRGLNRMLKRHGKNLTLTIPNGVGSYNPHTGEYSSVNSSYIVSGYFYSFSDDAIDGDTIQSGDSRVVLKSTQTNGDATPKPDSNSKISYSSDTWSVVGVDTIWSGPNVMCYLLHVRN